MKDDLKAVQASLEKERKSRVNVHNELQYKKLEKEKLVAERVELKLASEKAVQKLEKQLAGQKAVHDEKTAKLEN